MKIESFRQVWTGRTDTLWLLELMSESKIWYFTFLSTAIECNSSFLRSLQTLKMFSFCTIKIFSYCLRKLNWHYHLKGGERMLTSHWLMPHCPRLLLEKTKPYSQTVCHIFICPFQQREWNKIHNFQIAIVILFI